MEHRPKSQPKRSAIRHDLKIRVVAPGQPRELLTTLTVAGYLLPAVGT